MWHISYKFSTVWSNRAYKRRRERTHNIFAGVALFALEFEGERFAPIYILSNERVESVWIRMMDNVVLNYYYFVRLFFKPISKIRMNRKSKTDKHVIIWHIINMMYVWWEREMYAYRVCTMLYEYVFIVRLLVQK